MTDSNIPSVELTFEELPSKVVRVSLYVNSRPEVAEWDACLKDLRSIWQRIRNERKKYCLMLVIRNFPMDIPKLMQLASILKEHREVIREFSLTTAVVAGDLLVPLCNFFLTLYRPVGSVEMCRSVTEAQRYLDTIAGTKKKANPTSLL
jgi:hypothetical protein